MPSAAYFPEATEVSAVLPGMAGSKTAGHVAAKCQAGQDNPTADNQDDASKKSVLFSQFLHRGLKADEEKDDLPVPDSQNINVLPVGALSQPDLTAALAALLQGGPGTGALPAETTTAQAQPAQDTADRGQKDGTEAAKITSWEKNTVQPTTDSTQRAAEIQLPKTALPSGAGVPADLVAEKSPVPQMFFSPTVAGAPVFTENQKSPATGPGAKLKLDFSVFDATFPEGWQALFAKDQSTDPAERSVPDPGEQNSGPALAEISGPGAGVKGEVKPGEPGPTALNLSGVNATAPQRQVAAQALNAGTANSGTRTPHSEKSLQPPASGQSDLHVETGPEHWIMPPEAKTPGAALMAPTAAAATPGQVFSRLNELQRQMVVENFSQSALPGFQGAHETLTVDLNPPELGRVQVHVEKAAGGNGVNAVVTIQDRTVGEYFQAQTETIRKTLEAAGITLGGLSVEIRQQFNQDAREKSDAAREKNAGLSETANRPVASLKKSPAWGSSGLSRVEIMV